MARRTEPAPPSLAERPSFLLSQIGAHTAARFAALLEPYGLTPRHFAVINALVANRGLSQQQLGDLLDIHRNSMVAVLDDLERDGFVERRPSSVDRRVNSLHPYGSFDAHESDPGVLEIEDRVPAAVRDALTARGHKLKVLGPYGISTGVVAVGEIGEVGRHGAAHDSGAPPSPASGGGRRSQYRHPLLGLGTLRNE